jgi:hypothetical protein
MLLDRQNNIVVLYFAAFQKALNCSRAHGTQLCAVVERNGCLAIREPFEQALNSNTLDNETFYELRRSVRGLD